MRLGARRRPTACGPARWWSSDSEMEGLEANAFSLNANGMTGLHEAESAAFHQGLLWSPRGWLPWLQAQAATGPELLPPCSERWVSSFSCGWSAQTLLSEDLAPPTTKCQKPDVEMGLANKSPAPEVYFLCSCAGTVPCRKCRRQLLQHFSLTDTRRKWKLFAWGGKGSLALGVPIYYP